MGCVKYVTVSKFAEMSGYSEDAIRKKFKKHGWLKLGIAVEAPDNRKLIDVEAYEIWVENAGSTKVLERRQRQRSRSTSTMAVNAAERGLSLSPPPLT